MSSRRQFLLVGAALGLIAGSMLGAGAVLAQDPAAQPPAPIDGVPLTTGATTVGLAGTATTGGGVAQSGMAIAYPYFGGAPGIAPDNTIVVTGVGQADLKTDGSNRAAAEKTALAAAIADAKAQADVIASATGLSISGVLSVSASVSSFGPVPYAVGAPGPALKKAFLAPAQPEPVWPQTMNVTVTVAYRVG